MIYLKSPKHSYLSPRGEWILKNVEGRYILDIGFIADKDFKPVIFDSIRDNNPQSFVIGLDINIEKLLNLHYRNSVAGNIFSLPFKSESFDCIIVAEVFEHLLNIYDAIVEIERVLKKGGKVIVTTPSPYGFFRWMKHWLFSKKISTKYNVDSYLGNYDHKVFWEPLSLCKLFSIAGLTISQVTTTNISIPYLPKFLSNPHWNLWPFNRLGTYGCFVFRK